MTTNPVAITLARADAEIARVRELFVEYAESIGIDLEYQGFSRELAELPGKYAAPGGELLVATVDGRAAGCVALRALNAGTLEMKRLYVRPTARGFGLGKRLVEEAISVARQRGYAELRLDTLETMTAARALYGSLGFAEIPPYGDAHIAGTCFYGLALT